MIDIYLPYIPVLVPPFSDRKYHMKVGNSTVHLLKQ